MGAAGFAIPSCNHVSPFFLFLVVFCFLFFWGRVLTETVRERRGWRVALVHFYLIYTLHWEEGGRRVIMEHVSFRQL